MEIKINYDRLPRVSIVIVNYNGDKWLKLFMPRIIQTSYPDFEIIVVDNASTDDSIQLLKNDFKEIRILELSENKGFAEGTNIGAKEATGEILAFLNNDIEVSNNWLTEVVMKLLSHNDAAAVQCKIMQHNNRNKIDCIGISVDKYAILRTIGYEEDDYGQYDDLQEIGAASGGAMILWRRIFYEVEFFDPVYFMYYEDIDLSWKIRLAGYKILPCKSSIVYHVGSATTKKSPSSVIKFHWAKNHISCWLKNSTVKAIALYWPGVLFCILGEAFFSMIKRQPSVAFSYFRAIFWTFKHIRYILRERGKVQGLKGKQDNINNALFSSGTVNGSSNLLYIIRRARRSL